MELFSVRARSRDVMERERRFSSSAPAGAAHGRRLITLRSSHKNQTYRVWRFELVLQTVYLTSRVIIVVVASNDPRKHEASNENRLHFTASRNFQSGDLETLVAFTPNPSAAKKERRERVHGGEREEEWGERGGRHSGVYHGAYNATQKRMINFSMDVKKSF